MELKDVINLDDLLRNPQFFTVDNEQLINRFDNDLLNESAEDDEKPEKLKTPWRLSFDELKLHMVPIPHANIYKRVMIEGIGDVMGRRKTRVHWTYSMFAEKEEDSFDSSFTGVDKIRTDVWDELMPGLWLALETMRKGEEAQFVIGNKLMFGDFGHVVGVHNVKPKSDVLLVAKLVDFVEIGSENACAQLTDEELRQFSSVKGKALEMLAQVNDLKEKRSYAHAISVGMQIIDRIRFCTIESDEEKTEKSELLNDVGIMLIDCYVKAEKYQKAITMIDHLRRSMDVDNNVSVLVNEAIAYSKIGDDFTRPIQLLHMAQRIHPHNNLVNGLLAEIQQKQKKYENDTKEFMRKAFQMKSLNKPERKEVEKSSGNPKLTEIIKSLSTIEIGSGIPLVGYTPNELKEIEDALKHDGQGHELEVTAGNNGKRNYTIKKST